MTETAPFDVYLVDPGTHASHVITLLQEVTGGSVAECAELVHETPARVASFSSRQAAEDLTVRFREFDAVAIIRRPNDPSAPAAPAPSVVPQPRVWVGAGMIGLGVAQLGLALSWLIQGWEHRGSGSPLLLGIGGLGLGALAVLAGVWKLTRRDLD